MATATITLYTQCKIIKDKNFVVENIEDYLATLSATVINNYQYQRFDLKKTIRIDLNQNWQTKENNLQYEEQPISKKWNYLKLSTLVNNNNVNYYYFITGYKQVAPQTIELSIEMDTINTFRYSTVYNNDTYTLSNKTIVKREHKDRLKRLPIQSTITNIGSGTIAVLDSLKNDNEYNNNLFGSSEKVVLINDVDILRKYLNTISASSFPLNFTYTLSDGSYILKNEYNKSTQIEINTIYNDIVRLEITAVISFNRRRYSLKFYNQDNEIVLQIDIGMTRLVDPVDNRSILYALVIPYNSSVAQTTSSTISWSDFIDNFYNGEKTVLVTKRPYKRIVDKFSEGLGTTLFKREDETLYDGDEEKHWMLAYRNDEATSTTVNTLLYPEETMNITTQTSAVEDITPQEIPNKANQEEWVKFLHDGDYDTDNYIEVNGTQYKIVSTSTAPSSTEAHGILLRKQNANDIVFKDVYRLVISSGTADNYTSIAQEVDLVKVHGWGNAKIYTSPYTNSPASGSYWQNYWVGSKGNITSGTVDSWKDVKLYDTKLIKAFIFPYCPSQYFHGRMNVSVIPDSYTYLPSPIKAIALRSANNNDFSYELEFGNVNPQSVLIMDNIDTGGGGPLPPYPLLTIGTEQSRKVDWESKLYNSDYYQPKFVYDSFSYTFNLEDINIDNWLNAFSNPKYFSVNYTVSTNIVSKFAFQFLQYVTERSTQDYEGVLCIERNNEKALYNSDYLNYIKNGGYNYDTKKANSQNAINGITTALSIVGAVASFASSGVTGGAGIAAGVGLAVGATTGIARGIYTAQEQDKAISQKMLQAQMQGNTVQGNEDLDILTVITKNKAKLVTYRLSDIMKNALWDLFHYCGYATYEQKAPEVDTRLYFNFVQADIQFKEYNFNKDIAEDIKQKWSEGITFFHKVNNTWDLDQVYENFETSLM